MSRLLSLGASVFTSIFVILFVIGAVAWVNRAVADEPLVQGCLDCEFACCEDYSPPCLNGNNNSIICSDFCACAVVTDNGDEGCLCEIIPLPPP